MFTGEAGAMHLQFIEERDQKDRAASEATAYSAFGWLFDVVFAGLLPALFLLFAPIQRFMPAGWVDPGIYFGLSMDYFDIVKAYGWDYHSLRVSFVLPNALANTLMPPIPARLIIVFGFYLLGLFALYDGVRILWGRMPAVVTTSFLAYSPVYLLANTAGYVDGAYLAYVLSFFAALARWSVSRQTFLLVVAGIFAMLAILAHTLAVSAVGLVILFFLVLRWEDIIRRPFHFVLGGLAGGLLTWLFFVVALHKIHFGIGAFSALRWIVNASLTGFSANYRYRLMDWLPVTTRHAPGIVVSLTLIFLLLARRTEGFRRIEVAAAVVAVAGAALLPALDLSLKGALTQSIFYAGLAVPALVIGTASLSAMLLPHAGNLRLLLAVLIALFFIATSWFAPAISASLSTSGLTVDLFVLTACGMIVGLVLLTPMQKVQSVRAAALVAIVIVCGLSLAMNRDSRQLYKTAGTIDNLEYSRAAAFVRNLLKSGVRAGRIPLFWFQRDEFAARDGRSRELARTLRFGDSEFVLTPYDTLASLRLWDRSLFLPELSNQSLESAPFLMNGSVTVVFIDQDNAKLQAAIDSLRNAGVSCNVADRSTFHSQSFDINVTLIELHGPGDRTSASCG
jgi:hypothetical protein